MDIIMKRYGLAELEKAIEDNKKRGWEVIGDIKTFQNSYSNFKYDNYYQRYESFDYTTDDTLYCVKMRKVGVTV
ncbi:hypothetical protein P8864_10580 [Priestia flexa]|uniref:hypothetical protein n=1 Tax=Priestia flexa TaxID=86664 RepID=UPI000C233CFD|nr:hypothetical protein [Priestia flexa]MEC0666335.1 hypothetical protein [Priestia flexa]